jgi:hypothetical protein
MAELTSVKFGLGYGQLITAQVQAYNEKGWGRLSSPNVIGAHVEVIPSMMTSLANGIETTEF